MEELSEILENVLITSKGLSDKLRPPMLESFGLPAALESLCTKFARQHTVKLEFATDTDSTIITSDLDSLFYRLLEEILRTVDSSAIEGPLRIVVHGGDKNFLVEGRYTATRPAFNEEDIQSLQLHASLIRCVFEVEISNTKDYRFKFQYLARKV